MSRCDNLVDAGRRQFLRGSAIAAAGAATVAIIAPEPAKAAPGLALVSYPSAKLANIADLKPNEPMDIAYPDASSPGVLIKLGTAVESGAGPDSDIVAFSVLCPHKGWQLGYNAGDKTLNCPGHFSRFDCENGGQQVWGHGTNNLPQFQLRIDDKGDIYAEAVDELIYGRLSNVLEG